MASKDSRGSSSKLAVAGSRLREEAERLIQKERYKDAVKQAKLSYKEQGTPENHRLLERAYFLRAKQLLQQGMRASAVEVGQHLLDFGVTGSDSLDELVRLLMTLGFEKKAFEIQERLGGGESTSGLVELAADQAVIHPERAGKSTPEIVRDAVLIRQALEKLQAKDEAGMMEVLRNLPRSSPLSEWKFFVRGLAGFYRKDAEETRANWDRLDPKRMAAQVAQRLSRLIPQGHDADTANLGPLEALAFGEPVLDRLRQVPGLIASQEWEKVFRLIGPLRQSLRRIDPRLAQRFTVSLIGSLIKAASDMELDEAERLVRDFTRVAEPLPIDPRWNRLWALVWDGPHADPSGAEDYWLDYIEDLKGVEGLNPSERDLAQAMVWNRLADLRQGDVEELLDPDGPFGMPFLKRKRSKVDERELKAAKKEVVDCLEQSLRLAPDYLPTYRLFVRLYREWHDPEGLEAAAKRLLKAFPEDFETLALLGRHYYERNDYAAALTLVQKARRLKPLDDPLRTLEWMIRIGLARGLALSKQWDEGRAEFLAAEQLEPQCRRDFHYLVRRATFEAKAGQAESSDQYLKEAQAILPEPAPLWLAMAIEATRYRMPKNTQDGYTKLWEAELKKKCRSETAGEMASLLGAYMGMKVEYAGRAGHVKQVVDYLKRTTSRLKYRREDIEQVCEFLGQLGDDKPTDLLEKLVKLGVKQHPESALLNYRAGPLEMSKGMLFGGGGSARKHLETALKLAESSTDPKVTALLPDIRNVLSLLQELDSRMGPFGFPFSGFGGPGMNFDPFFDDDYDDDDDDYDDDDYDDGPGPGPSPNRALSRKRKKQQRKARKKR